MEMFCLRGGSGFSMHIHKLPGDLALPAPLRQEVTRPRLKYSDLFQTHMLAPYTHGQAVG